MSDIEKQPEIENKVVREQQREEDVPLPGADIPTGWKYKSLNLGLFRLPYYASPKAQLILVAFTCFLCPGMFNALNGMGGGGQLDTFTANASNAALYAAFAVTAFLAGTVTNRLGVKIALAIGGTGYSLYIASFLSYNYDQNKGFCIFAGIILGICAGLLWTAQGAIMMSYPKEKSKGRYISWFWVIFNFGGVVGGLIPLGTNINRNEAATVSNGTYIGFLVLTFCGALMACSLVKTTQVVRTDGSHVIMMVHPSWATEMRGLVRTLVEDWYIIGLFPMFWASNWFYTYQFNGVNAAYFSVRTRALNSILYWTSQMIGATVFGYSLDYQGLSRPLKAKICWGALMVLTLAIWGGGYDFEKRFTRTDAASDDFVVKDWTSTGYVGPMFLYMFYGFFDSVWQTSVYWYMGSLSNNSRKLACFAGFYKGIQSAGGAVAFGVDAAKIPYVNEFGSCWGLLIGGLLIAAPVIFTKVRTTVAIDEDLKFSDETFDEVAPTAQRRASEPHE
ncbi:MAG: hypothetical protein Q9162_007359 [Coniocarpon cinnabarinum]